MEQSRFIEWQNEIVYTKKYGDINIKQLLNKFIFDSLVPFINKVNKYNFDISSTVLGNLIATMLYRLDYNKYHIHSLPKVNTFCDEHYIHFEYIVPWEEFWKFWNTETNGFFEGAEIHIQHLVWAYIDLDSSATYIDYMNSIEEPDSEDEYTKKLKKIDPYILDQMNKYSGFKNSRKDD